MKIISMKQLRKDFNPIRKGLQRGQEYLLMYRSKPLANLVPYVEETEKKAQPQVNDAKAAQKVANQGNKDVQEKVAGLHRLDYEPITKALTALNRSVVKPQLAESPTTNAELKKQAQFQLDRLKKILSPK